MTMTTALPSRRHLLQGASLLAALSALPTTLLAQTPPVCRVLALSDMHSAYERTAQLLAAFEAEIAANPVPHVIAINGDLFEKGNVVSVRSEGVIDWAFLEALPKLAPTVFNLGNHDNDLITDLARVVARMQELGIHVVTTLKDTRTGREFAPSVIDLPMGNRRLRVVGIGTNALNTYPRQDRELLDIPAPEAWARDHLTTALEGSDLRLVLAHVGVAQERQILPLIPPHSLLIGGHNHLLFEHTENGVAYAHSGSWTNAYTVAEFAADASAQVSTRHVALGAPQNQSLAQLIASTLATHLTDEDRQILGHSSVSLSLGDTGRKVALGLAAAAGADVGFIGHTTLGTGVEKGPVTRFAYDAIVRFEGKLMVAEVTRDQLTNLMARANQDRPTPLANRLGDFVYGAGEPAPNKAKITIATNDWCALNQQEYFGTTDLTFREVPSPGIKAIGRQALLSG